jgi:uncharacterized membrane protein HdeD (DUF308 family)
MLHGFLLGVIATASITAAAFFWKFWRQSRDSFFLSFAVSFLIQGLERTALVFFERPNEGAPWIYFVRLLAMLIILAAILKKNYSGKK